jgi:hypothetical protein
MNPEEPRDTIDHSFDERWLDDTLAGYSSAEPRLGLETRILAGIRAHAAQRRCRWMFAFAGALALVLLAVLVTTARTGKRGNPGKSAQNERSPQMVLPVPTRNVEREPRNVSLTVQRRHRPATRVNMMTQSLVFKAAMKQEHFPADRPISEQDRLLLNYLSQTSHSEVQHVVAVQQEMTAARQRWEEEVDSQERP